MFLTTYINPCNRFELLEIYLNFNLSKLLYTVVIAREISFKYLTETKKSHSEKDVYFGMYAQENTVAEQKKM